MKQHTNRLVPLYEDAETTRMEVIPKMSSGLSTCSWVNSMLRSSGVMMVAHSHNMGDFRVLGVVQEGREWVRVRVVTKSGEGAIILPWYSQFDLFLGSP